LRAAVLQSNIPMILFEAGEVLRFDEFSIQEGLKGILQVMKAIGMLNLKPSKLAARNTFIALSSSWVRASQSGIFIPRQKLGKIIRKGDVLGEITNPFGDHKILIKAHEGGMIVGMSMLPLANNGDALFHIACQKKLNRKNEIANYSQDNLENIDPVNQG
jgi:hypothetical protein